MKQIWKGEPVTSYTQYGDGAWEGALKWVKVRDREEVGTVVDGGKNIGREYCVGVLFESTGQVCYYRIKDVQRSDQDGNTEPAG
jgi:hypothetical protein